VSRLLVATRSRHKLRELQELLDLRHAEVVSPDDVGVPDEPDETGLTFETNARLKARFYAARSGLPSLADDSGLEVDSLGGRPGVHTRRYAGPKATDADNNARLLEELEGVPTEGRGARYVCVLALALPEPRGPRGGIRVRTVRGTFRGRIATMLRGDGGFGYDPLFLVPEYGRTFGELPPEVKQAMSHRANAFKQLRPVLERVVGRK